MRVFLWKKCKHFLCLYLTAEFTLEILPSAASTNANMIKLNVSGCGLDCMNQPDESKERDRTSKEGQTRCRRRPMLTPENSHAPHTQDDTQMPRIYREAGANTPTVCVRSVFSHWVCDRAGASKHGKSRGEWTQINVSSEMVLTTVGSMKTQS